MTLPERRLAPRFDAELLLRAELVGHENLDLHVIDVGLGGVLIESYVPFVTGVEHEVRLTTSDGAEAAVLKVRTVYCHRRTASETDQTFSSGFAFLELDDPSTSHCAQALVDAVKNTIRQLSNGVRPTPGFTLDDPSN